MEEIAGEVVFSFGLVQLTTVKGLRIGRIRNLILDVGAPETPELFKKLDPSPAYFLSEFFSHVGKIAERC